ncbi:MAG: hypothetical protein IJ767_03265 [Bacteroidaceae bacterium]|nr:hypothetical protein [Bacteroidaceae bacterium]
MKKISLLTASMLLLLSGFLSTVKADDTNMTSYIVNPSFEQGTDGWSLTNFVTQGNKSFKMTDGAIYIEKWTGIGGAVGNALASQKIMWLPAGNYRMVVGAHNIQQKQSGDANGTDEEQTGASIYALKTSNKTTVTAPADYSIEFSTEGGSTAVTIGFNATNATGNWLCVDNFRLYYVSANLTMLQTAITNAQKVITDSEKSSYAGLQPAIKAALTAAIANAQAATEATSDEELRMLAFELVKNHEVAKQNLDDLKALKTLTTRSASLLTKEMAKVYLDALQIAYDEAIEFLKLETDAPVAPVTERLQAAYDAADASRAARTALNNSITTATRLLNNTTNNVITEGREEFEAAINAAIAVRDSDTATPEEMTQAKKDIENATLLAHVLNPTGTTNLTVKTGTVIAGTTVMFARGTFGGTSKEAGFCWSESPEPTIFDSRATTYYDNNGNIYYMEDVKPATVYYVRAYAFTSGYRLFYGDIVKVATLPKGNTSGYYDEGGPDEATNKRVREAFQNAMDIWNSVNSLDNFTPSVHYSAGTPTADCSYGGWIRMGANSSYQRTGTIMHEMAHGVGVIPNDKGWNNATYRAGTTSGIWLGPRVDRVVQFLENNASAHLNGDYQHMWPYGINGAGEDTGAPMLYRGNGLIIEALIEDGLIAPNQNFAHPAYTFTQDDDTKYYLKSEATNRGLATSYLRQTSATNIRFEAMTADEAFANDSCAWYITYNPKTCYYSFKNAATGRYLSMSTGTATASTGTANTTFQLLGARAQTTLDDFTFAGTSYWVVSSNNHYAMNATATGASGTSFNHNNSATTQRWLLLTGDEVTRFAEARGETVGIVKTKTAIEADVHVVSGQGVISITAVGQGQDVHVYSLDGREVKRLYVQCDASTRVYVPRGLYLVNGKKVLVR